MIGNRVSDPTSIFDLLAAAAAQHGARPAVRLNGSMLTYRELSDHALRMARALKECGAAPGVCVAHSFQKSFDALVALFAIARTGAAYVPLDPQWPAERVALIAEDAGLEIWTGTQPPPTAIAGRFRAVFATQEAGDARPIAACVEGPAISGDVPAPDRGIANVLFTSGSTGRPKGVEITTRSLTHFAAWGEDYFRLTPDDVIANHAPFNFDLSTFDIFAAVHSGATICPVPERLKMFPYQLAEWIARERITIWYSVPSALAMLLQRGRLSDHDLTGLRHVIFAGEPMPKPVVRQLGLSLLGAHLTNLYGPTETNVCTFHRVTKADLDDDGSLPIGMPIRDTRAWIMESERAEAEAGELWIAGPAVTTGYLGDPALTAQRLVSAPDGAGQAYRTGDRVRRRSDGVLLFEGRIDRMVKCRGHRVEPGEIEAVLYALPAVRQAAVVPVPDALFGHRLRACVAFHDGAGASEAEMIAHCRSRLPVHMVPDEWDIRGALPETDRGKFDLLELAR